MIKIIDQVKFINKLTDKLTSSIIDYQTAKTNSSSTSWDYKWYLNSVTSTKESIKQRIIEIRKELLDLYKFID